MEKRLFLSDEPIEELTQDAFRHKAFVETLHRCVKDCDCKINIGLFGRWGVGKTSIVKLLIKKLKVDDEKIKTLFFDAWKYSHGSLPQELVLTLNKEYGIVNQDRLETEIYGIQEEEAPPIERGWRSTLQRIWRQFKISIISTPILLGLFMSLYYLGWITISVYTSLIFIVFLPIIVNLIIRMDSAMSLTSKVKMLPAKFDPGRLENKFEKIVNGIIDNRKADRLVVIIDNLDRCSGETAIEMLETVKTLVEHDKCVYVFPCDYSALIKHLVSVRKYKESDAREFLRKFFGTSFTIPSFLAQDLEEFANDLLPGLQIPYSQAVLQVIVNAFTENPRSIKQFLNNLTAQYLAAQEREKTGIIGEGEITRNDGFLAKLLIIRQEYPSFYAELELREGLLGEVETYLRKGGNPPSYSKTKAQGTVFVDNPGLERFLVSTRTITAEDIVPFLKLNKETYPSTIPDAEEFKLEVNRGNVDYVLVNMDKIEQEDEKKDYVRRVVRVIDRERIAKHWNWVFNGLDILIKIYGRIPTELKPEITTKIGSLMTLADMRGDLDKFDYGATFSVLRDMEETYRSHILDEYMLTLEPGEIDQDLVDQVIGIYDLMPQTAVDNLNVRLIEAYELNRDKTEPTITKLGEKPEVSDKLISQELAAKIEQLIDDSVAGENKRGINLYLRLASRSSDQTKLSFLQKTLGIISTNRSADYDETKQFGVQTLLELDSTDIPSEGIDELYKTLNEFTGLMNPPNKLQFVTVFFWFFELFTESQQGHFLHDHLLPLIDSGDASILNNVLEIADGYDVKILAYDFVLDRLTKRVRTNLPDLGLIESITRKTPREDKQKVKDMIIELINRPEPPYYNAGLESFKQLYSEFRSSQIGEICDACLQRGTSVPQPEKQKFIISILEAFEKCPAQFKRRFADFTSDFITGDDPDIRDMGIDCFNRIEALIEEGKKKTIIIQLLQAVEQKANQDEIDEDSGPLLDLVIAEQAMLERNDKVRLIDTLLGLRNEAKDKEVRLIGLKYLGKVDKFYHRKKLVIGTLQADLESADEEIREQAKQTVEALKAT